jgi:hypothetical protein
MLDFEAQAIYRLAQDYPNQISYEWVIAIIRTDLP